MFQGSNRKEENFSKKLKELLENMMEQSKILVTESEIWIEIMLGTQN